MGRPKKVEKSSLVRVYVPEKLAGRVELELFSEVEKKVPHGKLSEFYAARLREHYEWVTLNLHPFGFQQGAYVRGPKATIEALETLLRHVEAT